VASTFLSRFTPSLNDSETLEMLLVQREGMLSRRLDQIRDSVLTTAKHYSLLVGPRGSGKTHLIALMYHRVMGMADLEGRIRIAWLQEEEWGAASFLDLLVKILTALAEEYDDQRLFGELEALYDQSPQTAEQIAARVLRDWVGDRTLLLLMENLDDLFFQIGSEGQKRLRSYLQENAFATIVATSQSLTGAFTLQTSPFYGFFTIYHLEEFAFEDTVELLRRIALRQDDGKLASFIVSPPGRARIRALRHLAGGNPRIAVVFSQFLTRESLDQLSDPFLEMLDDLTPYYQDRIRVLSPQQRKITEFLCEHSAPAQVKEIARRCFISSQTASSQLRDLRGRGYVHYIEVGRESYYELSEPLMRLVFEVKKHRGEPIRLFVDFLKIWYTSAELHEQMHSLPGYAANERKYLALAIQARETEDPCVLACIDQYAAAAETGNWKRALEIAEELVAVRGAPADLLARAECLGPLGSYIEALADADRVIEVAPREHWAWAIRAMALQSLGRSDEAITAAEQATILAPGCVQSWYVRALLLLECEDHVRARSVIDQAIRMAPKDYRFQALNAHLMVRTEDYEGAAEVYRVVLQHIPQHGAAWSDFGLALRESGDSSGALSAFGEALRLEPENSAAYFNRAAVFESLGDHVNALQDYEKAIELGAEFSCAYFNQATTLLALDRWEDGIAELSRVLDRYEATTVHVTEHTEPILRQLLQRDWSSSSLSGRIRSLVELYNKHCILEALGQALVQCIPLMVELGVESRRSETWSAVWSEVGSNRPELEVPLRFLGVANRWRKSRDPRVVLELPMEARQLLEDLLPEVNTTSR
jgi:tetratricopeptide (TPR) repeat protein